MLLLRAPSSILQATALQWRTILILFASLMVIHFFVYQPVVRKTVTLDPAQGKPITIFSYPLPLLLSTEKSSSDVQNNDTATSPIPTPPIDSSIPTPESEYIAICVSVRDQTLDLPEWLTHHYHHLGIRRFYIMDDGSVPPLSSLPEFHYNIPSSALTFVYEDRSTRTQQQQITFYNRCLGEFGSLHEWIAFIDVDEFFATPSSTTLHELLYGFEKDQSTKVGALAVNWRMHTSAGLLHRPSSTRNSFLTCIWDDPPSNTDSYNSAVKSIVRPRYASHAINPHMFALNEGAIVVGELGDRVESEADRRPITREKVALHHYVVKSTEEFEDKMGRSNGMGDAKGWEFWDIVEEHFPHVECSEMRGYDP